MTLPRVAALVVAALLAAPPALADTAPGPPIVFDACGRGTVREDRPAEDLPAVRYLPAHAEMPTLYGVPWWIRPWWDYDEAALYLFGDPYYGRKYLDTLERVQWPGWCP